MYPVSRDFLEKIKANTRRIYGKVQIDWTDPFIDQSIQVEVSEEARISWRNQVADALEAVPYKWASLDGSWILDGTYYLAPDTEEDAETHQMGWWGNQLSGEDYSFTEPYPTLTVSFAARPVRSLKVVGDNARAEYPVDFDINLYDASDNLLYTENVIGNDAVKWEKNIDNVNGVEKIELVIKKWSHIGRQAKITEFFTSIQETYEGDDIILINLLEERETSQGSLPIGNISSNEIDIRLYNRDRKFDAGNYNSNLYQLVKTNRRIKAWLGVEINGEIEYVPLGTFWSGDWNVPENEVYAETSGRDRLELLRKSTYSSGQVRQNVSLYELAIDILEDAGLDSSEYFIDPELQQKIIPWAYFSSKSHRAALKDIAEAALGQVYVDREGIIRVEGPSYIQSTIKSFQQFIQGAPYPADGYEAIEAYGIGADDYFSKDQPSKSGEMANYIIVDTQPLRPADNPEEVYRSNDPVSINAGQTKSLTVFFNSEPVIEATASLEGQNQDTTITNAIYYAWGANIEITNSGTASDTFTLIITGKPLVVQNKERAIAKDDTSIIENGKITYTFPGNHLIQTLDMAQDVANTLLASFKDPRRDVSIEWRGNPAIELADIITLPDYQRDGIDKRGYYYVTRQELEYDGGLRASLEGRKI